MSARRRAAVALLLAALVGGCDSAPSPSPSPSTSPPAGAGVDAARLAAVEAAVPVDGLEVREGGERSCATDAQCLPGTVRSTLHGSEELPERSWEATAGWLREAVEPWVADGWQIVYSVCAPTRAGTALVKELDADGGHFVALARLDTRDGARTVEVTVPRAEEGADPWETTRTMLPDAACWHGAVPAGLVEQSTPPAP
ncbi:hypothetical protein M3148_06235 [Georgenia satyanarayanai]|uniref:hypothetical protein n=1 Tax=Georgenia satyanarayanai TaxID=860221 RepID=UPI00203A9AE2|nr:hypothetical protein [Georgenia satyanarayanai]MCM3660593.1 hypothetical protein [Georgenia satyanarayanai]